MFRFIHTSDWHIGHVLYDYERTAEQRAMLSQLAAIVEREQPDALLISGDLFHTSQPSARAVELLTRGLLDIRRAGPDGMRIIATAGNHDSASRHEAESALWATAGVDMIGLLHSAEADSSRLLVQIPGKALVLAVPYVHERNLPDDFFGEMLARAAETNPDGLPLVMMAHTSVGDARTLRLAREAADSTGGIDMRALGELGTGYDYLALGHIHTPHTFAAADSPALARYCGSPLAVSFDERFAHSVSLVEISGHGPSARVEVREIAIDDPCPPVNIPAEGFAPWDEVLAMARSFPAERECYLRLNAEVEDYLPVNAREEALAALEGKAAKFCLINSRRTPRVNGSTQSRGLTVSEFRAMSPLDIAEDYARRIDLPLDDDLTLMLKQVIADVKQ